MREPGQFWSLLVYDGHGRPAGRSDRCIMTTTDQLTGVRGKEPLRTLATFRRDPVESSSVYFGANFINESKRGTVRVGDAVDLI